MADIMNGIEIYDLVELKTYFFRSSVVVVDFASMYYTYVLWRAIINNSQICFLWSFCIIISITFDSTEVNIVKLRKMVVSIVLKIFVSKFNKKKHKLRGSVRFVSKA